MQSERITRNELRDISLALAHVVPSVERKRHCDARVPVHPPDNRKSGSWKSRIRAPFHFRLLQVGLNVVLFVVVSIILTQTRNVRQLGIQDWLVFDVLSPSPPTSGQQTAVREQKSGEKTNLFFVF